MAYRIFDFLCEVCPILICREEKEAASDPFVSALSCANVVTAFLFWRKLTGLGIISGRSDGDTNSGGTEGCRCCATGLQSCLAARSGTSMAAASVAATAALVIFYLALSTWKKKKPTFSLKCASLL